MGYRLTEDYEYVVQQLGTLCETIGISIEDIDNLTLNDLMNSCSNTFGSSECDESSPIDRSRYAKLRLNQLSIRRFWYMYKSLKWRIENV